MTFHSPPRGLGSVLVFAGCLTLSAYFTFAAVQGDYGLFRRIEIEAETRRLSDDFLDVDLLDERARDVLGLLRHDELVVQ